MPVTTHRSLCRFCHAHCAVKVRVEDGRVASVIGDKDDPLYAGFTCAKGREVPRQMEHAERLLHSQRRRADGTHEPIASAQAIREIADKLRRILDRDGPRAIAAYTGTYSFPYPPTQPMGWAFMDAIGSPMRFTSNTIDQPGKTIALAMHGSWGAGPQVFDDSDTWLLLGLNPLVAMSGGVPNTNPAKQLHQAKKRGLQLIVIDPRRTEVAEHATVHLQPKPGEDPTILAGLLRVIIAEGLHDERFIDEHVNGLEALRAAVEPFTPEYVERRAGVPAAELIRAARIFASAKRGCANAGTGPNMAGHGNVTEYLLLALITVCGRWLRAGERVPNPGALLPQFPAKAQANPPWQAHGYGEKLRVRGFTDAACGLATAALAEEILLDGPGQVKALFVLGGNPMMAWPDQKKTHAAMKKLELLVTLDIKMSATAKLAHYVVAPRVGYEVPGLSLPNETLSFFGVGFGYTQPYAMYAPKLVDPPAASDLIEDWELFYGLAQQLGLQLKLSSSFSWGPSASEGPTPLDMQRKPTTDELYELLCKGSRVPLATVKAGGRGALYPDDSIVVAEKDAGWTGKLDVGNAYLLGELAEIARESAADDARFAYRLISRRLPDIYNSSGRDIPRLTRKWTYNPAFMHPHDLAKEGLATGDTVEIASGYDRILGIVEADDSVRSGAISMPHAFGGLPEEAHEVARLGSNTGALTPVDRDYDPITGIPRMSAIPVNVRRVRGM
ncbi:MAG: molybdopterin-dependent oxidoreductase [Deltaproteobacteria bacterium]|nr:molybdopterin-dependent oxidoreductase [Deltaproteobacteria bacterium]